MTDRLPWANWMAYGLGHLRLSPAAFWSLSLAEWRAMLGELDGRTAPLSRAEFDDLSRQFPDSPGGLPAR